MASARSGVDFLGLPARAGRGLVNAVVDTPRGSRNKYKYDAALHAFRLSRVLPRGMQFPYDFGFVPSTRGEDGDALDVIILGEEPCFVGCVLTVALLGVVRAKQTEHGETLRNDRLLAVARTPVNVPVYHRLRDVPRRTIAEIEQFFVNYNRAQGRKFVPLARGGAHAAERLLTAGLK